MTETRRPQFRRGIHVLVLFLIVGVVKSVLTAGTRGRLVGPDAPPAFGAAVTAGSYAVSLLIVVAVLRYEEVGLREVGAARRPLLPGIVAVAGLWAVGNVVVGLAVVATADVFAAAHVPQRVLVEGMALAAVPSSLTTVFRFAVLTGIVYVATRNVFLVGLFHGIGNRWPLFVELPTWPVWLISVWLGCEFLALAATVRLYRRWAAENSRVDVDPA